LNLCFLESVSETLPFILNPQSASLTLMIVKFYPFRVCLIEVSKTYDCIYNPANKNYQLPTNNYQPKSLHLLMKGRCNIWKKLILILLQLNRFVKTRLFYLRGILGTCTRDIWRLRLLWRLNPIHLRIFIKSRPFFLLSHVLSEASLVSLNNQSF
jgi:hypothetical protein